MKQILIIEDDIHVSNLLHQVLLEAGYQVSRAYSGTEALLLLSTLRPNLVLLDLMLPGLSGEELLPHLAGIPVIVLSAKAEVEDKVSLLLGGAADYITKPFDIQELLARIHVQLRQKEAAPSPFLCFDDIRMDPLSYQVWVGETPLHLTPTEFAILKLLLQHPNQVITKSAILDHISLDTPDCTESSLKIHMSNLRKKLRQPSGKDYIEAVWGIGFQLKKETD